MSHSDAYHQFIASMTIDYDKWHDGEGYDLDALAELDEAERETVTAQLVARREQDWRDVEALAVLDTPAARTALRENLASEFPLIRLRSAEALHSLGEAVEVDAVLADVLTNYEDEGAFGQALDLAPEYSTEAVKQSLLRAALHHPTRRIHSAAMLLYLAGQAEEPFDWNHRPFFLRFGEEDAAERRAAFAELCQRIGVDPASVE